MPDGTNASPCSSLAVRHPIECPRAAGSLQALLSLWEIFHRQGAIESKDTDKALSAVLSEPIAVANTPAEFTQMLREETDQWAKALSAIGLKR